MFYDDPKLILAAHIPRGSPLLRYAAERDMRLAALRHLQLAADEWRFWRLSGADQSRKSAVQHYVEYRQKRARLKLLLKRRGIDYDAISIRNPLFEAILRRSAHTAAP